MEVVIIMEDTAEVKARVASMPNRFGRVGRDIPLRPDEIRRLAERAVQAQRESQQAQKEQD
jgi:hypothetical protein